MAETIEAKNIDFVVDKIKDEVSDLSELQVDQITSILSSLKLDNTIFNNGVGFNSEITTCLDDSDEEHKLLVRKKFNRDDACRKVIDFLTENNIMSDDVAIRPLEIAHYVFGSGATKKSINPILYSLLTDRKISKVSESNSKRPRWYLLS